MDKITKDIKKILIFVYSLFFISLVILTNIFLLKNNYITNSYIHKFFIIIYTLFILFTILKYIYYKYDMYNSFKNLRTNSKDFIVDEINDDVTVNKVKKVYKGIKEHIEGNIYFLITKKPITIGILRYKNDGVILISEDFFKYTKLERKSMLYHELGHYKFKDNYLFNRLDIIMPYILILNLLTLTHLIYISIFLKINTIGSIVVISLITLCYIVLRYNNKYNIGYKQEERADLYSAKYNDKKYLISALKNNNVIKSNTVSHPPIRKRIFSLKRLA